LLETTRTGEEEHLTGKKRIRRQREISARKRTFLREKGGKGALQQLGERREEGMAFVPYKRGGGVGVDRAREGVAA